MGDDSQLPSKASLDASLAQSRAEQRPPNVVDDPSRLGEGSTLAGKSSLPDQSISELLEQAHGWSAFGSSDDQQVVEHLIERWQMHCEDPGLGRLGNFELTERVGGGGYGVVYRATDSETGRTLALKILRPKSAADFLDAVTRFHREAEVATLLNHPHIVRGLANGTADGRHYLAMEFAERGSLRELLKRRGQLPWREAAELIRQAADGLAHLNAQGWVHRDLKPGNLLLTDDDTVKIGDLGLVREPPAPKGDAHTEAAQENSGDESDATSLTTPGRVLGTLHYMAPEQGIHSRVSIQADIYSLGAVLFELIAGRPLVDDLSARHNLHYRTWRDAPRLGSVAADVPPELDKVVARMVARLPEVRYASPQEVVAALTALLVDPAVRPRRWRVPRISRRAWGIGMSLAGCAALGAPLAWWWASNEIREPIPIGPTRFLKTIEDGIRVAKPGDTILLDDGIYHEAVTIPVPLTIKAVNIGGAVVDAEAEDPEGAVFDVRADCTFVGLHIRNTMEGIAIRSGDPHVRVERVIATNVAAAAFTVNLPIERQGTMEVVNCLVVNCGRAAVINDGNTIHLFNTIIDNVRTAYGIQNGSAIIPSHCLLNNIRERAGFGPDGGEIRNDPEEITADPLFVERAVGDFRLTSTSPAVNSGTDVGLPFLGRAPDLGPFEFDPQRPPLSAEQTWIIHYPTEDSKALYRTGEWTLRNRGWLVSREDYPDGVEVKFDWQWTEGEGTYSDNLALGFYTTGQPGTTNWASELEDGVVVRFQPDPPPGTITVVNAQTKAGLAETYGPALPKQNEMHVRIRASMQEIRIYLDGGPRPVLRCPVPQDVGEAFRVCIYNRERVADIDKESRLRNIRLTRLPAQDG